MSSYSRSGLIVLLVVLNLTRTTYGADLVWTGGVNMVWDTNTLNWTQDGVLTNYSSGDNVRFDNSGVAGTIQLLDTVWDPGPANLVFDNSNGVNYTIQGFSWGQGFHDTLQIEKKGAGQVTWEPSGGSWWNPGPTQLQVIVRDGTFLLNHWHENAGSPFGKGATLVLAGGTFRHNSGHGNTMHDTDLHVAGDAVFWTAGTSAGYPSTIGANGRLTGVSGVTLTIEGSTFKLNNDWDINLSGNSLNRVVVSNGGGFDFSGPNVVVSLNIDGIGIAVETVIIDYSAGSVSGSAFAMIQGLPAKWSIDYDGTSANPNAVVLIGPQTGTILSFR